MRSCLDPNLAHVDVESPQWVSLRVEPVFAVPHDEQHTACHLAIRVGEDALDLRGGGVERGEGMTAREVALPPRMLTLDLVREDAALLLEKNRDALANPRVRMMEEGDQRRCALGLR